MRSWWRRGTTGTFSLLMLSWRPLHVSCDRTFRMLSWWTLNPLLEVILYQLWKVSKSMTPIRILQLLKIYPSEEKNWISCSAESSECITVVSFYRDLLRPACKVVHQRTVKNEGTVHRQFLNRCYRKGHLKCTSVQNCSSVKVENI